MAGQLNNITTVNIGLDPMEVDADDVGNIVLFGDPGAANADVSFLADLVGQVVTLVMSIRASGANEAGATTAQLFTFAPDTDDTTLPIGPTFVLPSIVIDTPQTFLSIVTFDPGQIVGGLGLRAENVGGTAMVSYLFTGCTIIVSD